MASPDLTGDGKADLVVRSADGIARVYPGNGAGGFGSRGRSRPARSPAATWSPRWATSTATAATTWSRAGCPTDASSSTAATGTGRLRPPGVCRTAGAATTRWRRPVTSTATATPTWSPATGPVTCGASPGSAGPARSASRCQLPGSWGQLLHDHRVRRLQRRRQARPAGHPRRASRASSARRCADGTFGHPLGQITRVTTPRPSRRPTWPASPAPDLVGQDRRQAQGAAQRRHLRARPARSRPGTTSRPRTWCSTRATGTATATATSSCATRHRRAEACARATARATSASAVDRSARASAACGLLAAVGDMTGDGWPDLMGQPAGGCHPDLPRQRTAGPQDQLRGPRPHRRGHPGARRALGRRRCTGQPVPQGLEADALPGQRAGRA